MVYPIYTLSDGMVGQEGLFFLRNRGNLILLEWKVKKILISLLCSFVAVMSLGCGDSSNDYVGVGGQQGPPGPSPTGGIAVNLSQADLTRMFSPEALAQGSIVDPRITEFHLYIFDAAGNLVAEDFSDWSPTANQGLSLSLAAYGLQMLNFNVVLAGEDANHNLVGAYQASNIFPLPNGLREVAASAFYPLDGFVLPDGNNGGGGEPVENIDVSVSFLDGVPQVAFTGGNAFSVAAVPEDLVEKYQSGRVSTDDFTRIYTRSSSNGTDSLSSPILLTDEIIPGSVVNPLFQGFEPGVNYQVSVVRLNQEFGYSYAVLAP